MTQEQAKIGSSMQGELEGLREKFLLFAATDGASGAPLYGELCRIVADSPDLLRRLRVAPADQRRPVLFLAAVHFLVLAHPQHAFARHFATARTLGSRQPEGPSSHGRLQAPSSPELSHLSAELHRFCAEFDAELLDLFATKVVQTNEAGRSVALWLALQELARDSAFCDSQVVLLELGPSAGINLAFDQFALDLGEGGLRGNPHSAVRLPCRWLSGSTAGLGDPLPSVIARLGLDRAPVSIADGQAVAWLEACVFADRVDRWQRLRSAIEVLRLHPPLLVAGDAIDDLELAVARLPREVPLVVFHSWVLTYVARQRRPELGAKLGKLSLERDVYWISAEPPGAVPELLPLPDSGLPPEAAANTVLGLTRFHRGRRSDRALAWCHPHLDWVLWL